LVDEPIKPTTGLGKPSTDPVKPDTAVQASAVDLNSLNLLLELVALSFNRKSTFIKCDIQF
jgi:hypothetical protein